MNNKKVILNEDEKAVVEREIKSVFNALSTLMHWVQDDTLTEEMKESIPNIVESSMKKVNEKIGYTGNKSERAKEMEESYISYLQGEVKKLENTLKDSSSMSGLSSNAKLAFDKIKKWWSTEGFYYISEQKITEGGAIVVKFGFMLESFTSFYSDTPETDKKKLQTKKEYLEDQGFQFSKVERADKNIIDNDKNRKLLRKLVKEAFPSAEVFSYENNLHRTTKSNDDEYIIRYFDVTISDLSDIDKLVIEDKVFLEDEVF